MTTNQDEPSEQLLKQVFLTSDKTCYCWRCGYEWISRKNITPPAICPRCRKDNWHTFRQFNCQKCGHTFESGNLYTPAYQLFPTCPACNSLLWHKERQGTLNNYLKEISHARPSYFVMCLWYLFISSAILSFALAYHAMRISSESAQWWLKPSNLICSGLIYLGLIVIIGLKMRSVKSNKINGLTLTKKITPQEAEWLKERVKKS